MKDPRINDAITADQVRLVDQDGEMLGVVDIDAALAKAEDAGMDLVEVSPNAEPPVCKILDYGKYKYEAQKKANEARKKQKVVHLKEIKMRPTIDTHDFEIKMKRVVKFIENGDKVKISIRFRGREMMHRDLGFELMGRIKEEVAEIAKVEQEPKLEGQQMMMMLSSVAK